MNTKRSFCLSCRLNEPERRALDMMVNWEGMPLSDLTRTLLREALEARGVKSLGLWDPPCKEKVENGHPS